MKSRHDPLFDIDGLLVTAAERDAILRTDLYAFYQKCFYTLHPGRRFLPNWHHEAIIYLLLLCMSSGDVKRLLANLPPRHGKSELISVVFSAWILAHDPSTNIIAVSYGTDLARKLNRDVRKILQALWYRRLFPKTVLADKRSETELVTTAGGGRYATTVRGEIIGHGADYIIIDDPHPVGASLTATVLKQVSEWYSEELVTRLTPRGAGVIIVVMQRAKPNDLSGYLLSQRDVRHLNVPLIAVRDELVPIGGGRIHARKTGDILHEAWMSAQEVERIKGDAPPRLFEAVYQQDPKPFGGNLLDLQSFSRFDEVRPRREYEFVLQTWDCASALSEVASYSVCITFGVLNDKLHVIDVWRGRLEYTQLKAKAFALIDQFAPTHVVIEDGWVGHSLYCDMRERLGWYGVESVKPVNSKVERAERYIRHFASGKIALPGAAPWLTALEEEISTFPNGFYDDQIDCLTLSLHSLAYGIFRRRALEYRQPATLCGYHKAASIVGMPRIQKAKYDPKVGPWSENLVRDDLLERIATVKSGPRWQDEESEAMREQTHDHSLARLSLLEILSNPKCIYSSAIFRKSLQDLSRETTAPSKAHSVRDFLQGWHWQIESLREAYKDARW